jgi:hypothetical protein
MNIEIKPEIESVIQSELEPSRALNFDMDMNSAISSAFHRGPARRSGYKLTGWLLASIAADILIIVACTCLFLIGSSLMLKLSSFELNQFVKPLFNQRKILQTGFYLYAYISVIYFILLRVFLGATVGEWSCGIRVGQPFERRQSSYAFKVCFRVFLILITGVLTLPILSLIFKKDLAGLLTKASLYTLK